MQVIANLKIKNKRRIEFLISNLDDLEEYGYFTDLKIDYYFKNTYVQLFDDFLTEGVKAFIAVLEKCIDGDMNISRGYFEKGIGYEWNKECHEISVGNTEGEDVTGRFLMWEANPKIGIATWMYNYREKTYLEISPEYKYHFADPEPNEEFVSFESFLSSYEMIDRIVLDQETIAQWHDEANTVMTNL